MKITEKEHGTAAFELYENWHSDAMLNGIDGNITVWQLLENVANHQISLHGCTVMSGWVKGPDGTIWFEVVA